MTATRHYHAPDGTFRKVLPPDRARREVEGWCVVAGLVPTPELRDVRQTTDGWEVTYEDIFASGRCVRTLADSINSADRQPGHIAAVRALVDTVCDQLLIAAGATGGVRRFDECVPALYASRLAPGGRLDRWYAHISRPAWVIDGQQFDLSGIGDRTLVAGGHALGRGWMGELFTELRSALDGCTRWMTAITQGDVTEPNIAEPACWLDFEHAGRNSLAGDAANFLWYLLAMGGWLVPVYQPEVYGRTLRTPVPPVVIPAFDHLRVTSRCIEIDYTWHVGSGRRAAVQALLNRLSGDLGTAIAPGGGVATALRPYLVIRVLGVIPLNQMSGPHALMCLAKVAELLTPTLNLPEWCAVVIQPNHLPQPDRVIAAGGLGLSP